MSRRGTAWHMEVIDILRREARPLTAYEILSNLRETNPKAAPPTVYRALAALSKDGKVHRLESINAYIPCQCHDEGQHASVLSICDDCGHVEESLAPDLMDKLSRVTGKSGFEAHRHIVEVHGLCASCGPEQATA